MVEHRPLLTSIRAFEAIARHKSISSAADELGVSQPAVSQQLRHLEGNLGCVLTIRRARGIELTREGEVLAARLTQAFAEIWAGIEIARRFDGRERSISVCLLPTFAQRWLVHRLVTFYERFPDIGVRLILADSIEDLDRVDTDIVIRCRTSLWQRRSGRTVDGQSILSRREPEIDRTAPDRSAGRSPQSYLNTDRGGATPS
jgi:LysR family glycine cleavage system transcriptional activator